jgi:CheY-like chemotaxis protein
LLQVRAKNPKEKRRAGAELGHIPIIALTILAMNVDRERCLEAGVNDNISKPVSL